MKKILLLFSFCLVINIAWSQVGYWTDEGNYDTSWWNGYSQKEYRISTPEQLAGLAYLSQTGTNFNSLRIILDNTHLNMSTHYWTPIKDFSGFFDGNGCILSGIHIQQPTTANCGVFAMITGSASDSESGVIYNLILDETCSIISSNNTSNVVVGGLVGTANANTRIVNCRFSGNIIFENHAGELCVGGIAGKVNGLVNACINEGDITVSLVGTGDVEGGGICAVCNGKNIRITGCINKGSLSGSSNASQCKGIQMAGIVATSYSNSIINNCLNEGNVSIFYTASSSSYSSFSAGGITTSNYGLIINSGNTGSLGIESTRKSIVGGISSRHSGTIANCYNTADIICNGLFNSGGGIAGIFEYSSIGGITPLIYGSYNLGKVTTNGSDQLIGSIAGDASYLTETYNVPTHIRQVYMSSGTGIAIGNDYYKQTEYIKELSPDYMLSEDFISTLDKDVQDYNDTVASDKAYYWTLDKQSRPSFHTVDVYCINADVHTARFDLVGVDYLKVMDKARIRYKKVSDADYTELPWNGTEMEISVSPGTEYEYLLMWEENGKINLTPTKKFRSEILFGNWNFQVTRTTADITAYLLGDVSKIKKVCFEVSKSHPNESDYELIARVEGGPINEKGAVSANVTGLKGNSYYLVRAIAETEKDTIYSETYDFKTKNTGVSCQTLKHEVSQTSISIHCALDTTKAEGKIKETGCYYLHEDTLKKHHTLLETNYQLWPKAKGSRIIDETAKYDYLIETNITELVEGSNYIVVQYVITDIPNEGEVEEIFRNTTRHYTTLPVKAYWELQRATQSTADIICHFATGDAVVLEKGLRLDGKQYPLSGSDSIVSLTDLYPDEYYSPEAYIKTPNGIYTSPRQSFSTKTVTVNVSVKETTQTSALIAVSSNFNGTADYTLGVVWDTGDNTFQKEGDICRITELPADTSISYRAFMNVNGRAFYSDWKTLTTKPIGITTEAADACSNTSATLHASTDCDTYSSAQFGFEWRKYDAPDLVPSNFLMTPSPVNNKLAFSLKGLSPNTYYKYRAFIKYQEKEYFSDWIGFGTADAFVLYPPIVQTLAITSPEGTSVILLGYIVSGSEDILQKGFEYWIDNATNDHSDKNIVVVDGEEIKAALQDLRPYTKYKYRCFAKTASGTTYGEEQSFMTGEGLNNLDKTEENDVFIYLTQNPIVEHATLIINGTQNGFIVYRIYSSKGNMIKSEEIEVQNGRTEIPFYANNYASGIYLLDVTYKNKRESIKMIIP